MTYYNEWMTGEHILVSVWEENFIFRKCINDYAMEMRRIFDDADRPFVYIHVFLNELSYADIFAGANIVSQGKNALFHHPNLLQTIFVTDNRMLRAAALGLNSPVFGFVEIEVCQSIDEALHHARQLAVA